jgi:hypothetical protein
VSDRVSERYRVSERLQEFIYGMEGGVASITLNREAMRRLKFESHELDLRPYQNDTASSKVTFMGVEIKEEG